VILVAAAWGGSGINPFTAFSKKVRLLGRSVTCPTCISPEPAVQDFFFLGPAISVSSPKCAAYTSSYRRKSGDIRSLEFVTRSH
jgi:hypothetical protein